MRRPNDDRSLCRSGHYYNPHVRPLEPDEIVPLLKGVDGFIAGLDYITAEVIAKSA